MSDSLWDWTLARARDAAASADPTPGGGSVAAISGTFGLSLVVMALDITHKKTPSDALFALLVEGRGLIERLSSAVDRDVRAFERYMQARRLPKANEAERAARVSSLAAATIEATEAPLTAADDQLLALGYAERVAPLVQPNVRSDVDAGADLLLGALQATLRNVDINLPNVRDETQRDAFRARANELSTQSRALYARFVPAR